MKKRLTAFFIFSAAGAAIAAAGIFLLLVWNGTIRFNHPSTEDYPVRGVDVSAYQGEIDWNVLASQDIDFAFIKATEGSTFVDKRFAFNFAQAADTDLRISAYHFFSFDSAGATQADNYIRTVPKLEGSLPPVVDVEFYGDKAGNPPATEEVQAQLEIFLTRLETHYGQRPIIYTTGKVYDRYIADHFEEYDIWIRNVYWSPSLSDGRDWTFWQYSDKGLLPGYDGEEEHIDLNVFCGTEEEFAVYAQ